MDPNSPADQTQNNISQPPPIDPSSISTKPSDDSKRFLIIVIFAAILALLIPTTVIVLSKTRQAKNIEVATTQQEPSQITCRAITITDTLNQPLTSDQLSALRPFDEIKVAINAGGETIDKARFRINGSTWQEVTIKDKGAFIGNYIIPEGIAKFTIEAEVHDPTEGWL